jgi:N-acetylglucosaminyldiphosphoundecaprenol N-acetyl-beta-D-mannosaminyltransferase
MKNRIELCSLPIDCLTMQQTLNQIEHAIYHHSSIHHVVVNAAKIVHAQKNKELYDAIVNCDIINADGQAVVWASRLLGNPLPERVAGIDLMQELVSLSSKRNFKIFFLGAKEEVVHSVVTKYTEKYGSSIIAGYRNGYFDIEKEGGKVALQIRESGAHILFVAITSPKKEIFLNTYKAFIDTPFIMGVGGSFDVVSGKVKRAPRWMQKNGLEWLYRVYQEPRRMWKRYLITNSIFIYLVVKERIRTIFVKKR